MNTIMMIGSKLGRHCGRVGIRGRTISCSLLSTIAAPSTDLAAVSAPASSYNDKYWMPFTDNHKFKGFPRKVFERASGVYYYLEDGTPILDGISGLWCCNAGHGQPKIVQAIQTQAAKLDFAASFNSSHKLPYLFAEKLLELLPGRDFSQVFFTMCGSTAVDTALKIALQYHRANGDHSKVRFIGRERGYHGVGFGGISVGGIMPNRKAFSGNMLPFVDHIVHTHSLPHMAYSKGQPAWGDHLADDLERVIARHDASTIAAVIIEPVAGSTGVLPPPEGYLQRIRDICSRHNVLLIFDEVITGFGRLGASFATTRFDVTPDLITCAKGLTNASVPAGAVITRSNIFKAIQEAAHRSPGMQIEFYHGYTYSGHPLAMAAGIATLEVYQEQAIFENAAVLEPYFEQLLHSLKGLPHVVDIRNIGLMGAVEVAPIAGFPVARSMDIFDRAFEKGVFLRVTGSTIAMSPPLVCERKHLDQIVDTLRQSIIESAQLMQMPH